MVRPASAALEVAQDRLSEKRLFTRLGIETPDFWPVDSQWDLDGRAAAGGAQDPAPGLRRQGPARAPHVRTRRPARSTSLGGVPLIAEELIAFDRELSVVAVRGVDGDGRVLPGGREPPRGRHPAHDAGAGAGLDPELAGARRVLRPRAARGARLRRRAGTGAVRRTATGCSPTRSLRGCTTPATGRIEGAVTSQFENHVRAVTGTAARAGRRGRPLRDGQPDRRHAADPGAWRPFPARTCTSTARRPGPGARSATSRWSARMRSANSTSWSAWSRRTPRNKLCTVSAPLAVSPTRYPARV